MKKITLFILVVLLAACTPLSYEEVKAREEYCKGKGMTPDYSKTAKRIMSVVCVDDKGNVYGTDDIRKSNVIIFPAT